MRYSGKGPKGLQTWQVCREKLVSYLSCCQFPLFLPQKWHFDLGATAGRCCAVIGLLTMIGGVILPGASMDRESSKTFSKISSESDSILANPLYADALKVVDANRQGEIGFSEESLEDGIRYLVQNGINEEEARKNLNIVVGARLVDIFRSR